MFTPPANSPQWFLDNLRQPGESRRAPYADGHVHYLCWNWEDESLPALLLVHGFSGHARWWSHLAPFFTARYRVASLDLPGMGDSAHLERYHEGCFAEGILAVIRQEALSDITIVGHSFGGIQSLRAMAAAPDLFRHGIVVDSMFFPPGGREPVTLKPRGSHTLYPSREKCLERFHLMPPQDQAIEAVLQFVAWHSCVQSGEGWHWKFDPNMINYGELKGFDSLRRINARIDCIYGECSVFNQDDLPQLLLQYVGNPGRAVIVPEACHHLLVDHPLELVEAINDLLPPTRGA